VGKKEESLLVDSGVDCMTILICDVDNNSSELLATMLRNILEEKDISGYTIKRCTGQSCFTRYPDTKLLFMEIHLGNENGLEIARIMREKEKKVPIVFVSSSAKYAVESYDVDAYGYLIKPFQPEKVRHIMDKFLGQYEEYIVKDTRGKEKLRVPLQNIEYFESKNTSILLHLSNGKQIRTYGKLGNIEKELENKNFLRCHQSYLINMAHIDRIEEACFIMDSGATTYIRKRDFKMMIRIFTQYTANK